MHTGPVIDLSSAAQVALTRTLDSGRVISDWFTGPDGPRWDERSRTAKSTQPRPARTRPLSSIAASGEQRRR